MKKEAILHIPLSQYAYAVGERALRIRIRAAREDIQEIYLCYGDRVDPNPAIRLYKVKMERKAKDDLFEFFECDISDQYTRVCYFFEIRDVSNNVIFYDERGLHALGSSNRTEYFQFPYIRREDVIDEPEWAKDIVMYHIFPDSFASGKRELANKGQKKVVNTANGEETSSIISETHLGGTLQGIMENLDYIRNLGINCIYLNPVFAANSYHKYDTIDYFSVDPCFGTTEDLKQLVKKCHALGIRVILDGVFNHCGPDFFAFRDVLKLGKESKYYEWFYDMPEPVQYADPPNYEAFAYVKEMPKLNTGNPEVEEYFRKVGVYWIEEADIDGWRLDVANEINHDFWRNFRKAVKAVKSDLFLIGEIWEDAEVWLNGDQFDSTMNYRFSYLCKDFFAENKLSVSEFDAQIQKMILRYPHMVSLAQMNFLDSHDVPRFLSSCKDKKELELAFFYLVMGYGIPSVFYGDECFIQGVEEPEYRRSMAWGTEGFYKKLSGWIAFRNAHSALRTGQYLTVLCDDEKMLYMFARKDDKECILIIINRNEQACRITEQCWQAVEEQLNGRIEEKKDAVPGLTGTTSLVSCL